MKRSIKRLAIPLIVLLMVGGMIPSSAIAEAVPSVSYCTHVQNVGWQNYVGDGEMSGTEGKSYRLEGIKIKLDASGYDLGISYQTHIQNIGWEADTSKGWKANDEMSGTQGLSYRLEAIQIKLTGADADKFDVYYQVHAQNMGWLGWAKNGESAGTAGFGYRLEGIRIVIVPVGTTAPNGTTDKKDPYYENLLAPYFSIQNEIKDLGWGSKYFKQLYYVFEDISNDGIPELIIGVPITPINYLDFPYSGKIDHRIAFVYQLRNGLPEKVVGRDVEIRGRYILDQNNCIIDFGTGGAQYHAWSYFKLDDYNLNFIESVHLDTSSNGEKYTLRDQNERLLKTLSKTEAYNIFDKYSIKNNIDWQPLNF